MQIYEISVNNKQEEITQHGNYGFPIAIYENQLQKNVLGYVTWHWHTELQFCYVINGTVLFYVNQKGILLHTGEGLFINSGSLHMAKPFQNSNGAYICIDFNPSLISGFPGSTIEKKYIMPFLGTTEHPYYSLYPNIPWQKKILEQLNLVHDLYYKKDYSFELRISIYLLEIWQALILEHLSKQADYKPISAIDNRRLKLILSYVHEHYSERITLEQLAEKIHVSTNECCRFFKKHMNCTLFEYLTDYRLIQSTELLENTDESISQIAYSCGFGSTSYYIDKFHKKIGSTPLEFRKNKKNNA